MTKPEVMHQQKKYLEQLKVLNGGTLKVLDREDSYDAKRFSCGTISDFLRFIISVEKNRRLVNELGRSDSK